MEVNASVDADAVRAAARATFARLKPRFAQHNVFWQLGHMLDTMVDYLGLVAPQDGEGFAEQALLKFLARGGPPPDDSDDSKKRNPWWYDDYGWWGIAGLNAAQYPRVFGSLAPGFRGIADLMWEPMVRNAPNVWVNASKNADFMAWMGKRNYAPRFPGGVWNWVYCAQDLRELPFMPALPNNTDVSDLPSIQNTVTNGLYWVLASRLHGATGQQAYLDRASTEFGFLRQWFTLNEPGNALLDNDAGGTLVRERVSTYSGLPPFTFVRGYDPKLFWAGDQGLILGGLVDYMRSVGSGSPNHAYLVDTAKAIADGVRVRMTDPQGLLRPWLSKTGDPPGGDATDYSTGIAVYMRYLAYAWRNSPELKSYLAPEYRPWLTRNVRPLLQSQPVSDDPLQLTNDLATLVCWLVVDGTP